MPRTPPSLAYTGFGLGFADFNHEGLLDIFIANGRVTLIEPAAPEIADKTWFRSSIQFGLTTGLNVLSLGLGVIMLGVMAGLEATGIFGIASAAAGVHIR